MKTASTVFDCDFTRDLVTWLEETKGCRIRKIKEPGGHRALYQAYRVSGFLSKRKEKLTGLFQVYDEHHDEREGHGWMNGTPELLEPKREQILHYEFGGAEEEWRKTEEARIKKALSEQFQEEVKGFSVIVRKGSVHYGDGIVASDIRSRKIIVEMREPHVFKKDGIRIPAGTQMTFESDGGRYESADGFTFDAHDEAFAAKRASCKTLAGRRSNFDFAPRGCERVLFVYFA